MYSHLVELEEDIAYQYTDEDFLDQQSTSLEDPEEDYPLIYTYDQLKERHKANSLFELLHQY